MISNLKGKLDALRVQNNITAQTERPAEVPVQKPLCRYERYVYPLNHKVGRYEVALGLDPSAELLSCLTQTELPVHYDARRILYLDTETTGLSTGAGTLAFLVALGFYEDASFVVEQYLMEDYDQESDLLDRLLARVEDFDCLVTYNGKSFDVPLLEVRCVMNRLNSRLRKMTQLDLLHSARRLYKMRVASCSLGNMERTILEHERQGDIPSAEIPECFFAYVKDRDPARMNIVLDHNRQDVLSMPVMMGAMLAQLIARRGEDVRDDYSMGRLFLRSGREDWAEACFSRAAQALPEARRALSLLYKQRQRWAEAVSRWQDMVDQNEGGSFPVHELAKYLEHKAKTPAAAYGLVVRYRQGMGQWGLKDEEIEKRYRRLKKYAKGDG